MLLSQMFPDAVQTEKGLQMTYKETGWNEVSINMTTAEDEFVFCFTMPVRVKSNACAAVQSYLDQIRNLSEGKITRAELLIAQRRSRVLAMETRMKQTAEAEAVTGFVDRCAGFFVTLSICFKWLEKKAADRPNRV